MRRALMLLWVLGAGAPTTGRAADRAAVADDEAMPLGDDEAMPLGEDEMPAGDDEMPAGEDDERAGELPLGEDGPSPKNPVGGPALVGLKEATEAACSERARLRGYLVVDGRQGREIDLAGRTVHAELTEGPGACVAQLEVDLVITATCTLAMRFSDDGDGSFYSSSLRFNVEGCPDMKGRKDGRYVLEKGGLSLDWSGDRDQRCLRQGELRIDGTATLRGGGQTLSLRAEEVSIRGDLPLARDPSLRCFKRRVAAVSLAVERGAGPQRRLWPWVVGGSAVAVAGGVAAYALVFAPAPTGDLVIDLR
jgi:hypothetical protein